MDDVPDPVETALSERRARRQEQLRLDSSVDLLGRGRDAAERRLAVRSHLAAGTVIAGVAVAADRWTLTLESPAGAGPLRHTRVLYTGLVRLAVRDGGRPGAPSPPGGQQDPDDASPLRAWLSQVATSRSTIQLWTSDGGDLVGTATTVSDHLVGITSTRGPVLITANRCAPGARGQPGRRRGLQRPGLTRRRAHGLGVGR
ncbi:MAG: hypothetical protein IPI82_09940 [Candidatus Microthrix sp.]|nr:hypothetical protein [Candidatus Microthrix sp.]MBK7322745.1 hypothetical protein [Candidatus Microthrix sp.]